MNLKVVADLVKNNVKRSFRGGDSSVYKTLLSQSIGRGFESHLVREFFIHYYTIDMLYVTPNTCYTHVYTHTGSE